MYVHELILLIAAIFFLLLIFYLERKINKLKDQNSKYKRLLERERNYNTKLYREYEILKFSHDKTLKKLAKNIKNS